MTWRGIDVSNHQGVFDFGPDRARGATWTGIKATEGTTFRDPDFVQNVVNATKLGMVVLPYHFGRPETDRSAVGGVNECRFFLSTIQPQLDNPLVGRVVLDYETVTDPSFADGFLSECEAHHVPAIIYCSASRVQELRLQSPRLAKAAYWIADYGVKALPPLHVTVWAWQSSDDWFGVDGDVSFVSPKTMLRPQHQKASYLVVRSRGRVVATVKYGGGRVRSFLKTHGLGLINRGVAVTFRKVVKK